MSLLTADQVGLPLMEALGISGHVNELTLHIKACELPTITVVYYPHDECVSEAHALDINKFNAELKRYKLVLIEGK